MQITPARVAEVDALYRSPQERAEDVNAAIQLAGQELSEEFSLFDLSCFAIQWLAMLATGPCIDDEELLSIAKAANIWLHQRHYENPKAVHGEPNRGEEK